MKLATHYLQQIENVDIFPIISLFIFMTLFVLVVIRAVTADKKFIEDAKKMPLSND
jgi:hypothetical protein